MYTIIVEEDNILTTTVKERIMQRSKLVDNLRFLTLPIYKEQDMTDYTVQLEYLLPCSKKYCSEILELSEERYKDYLQYTLPFDTSITSEAGDVELQLTFVKTEINASGKSVQRVRKTSTGIIHITSISAWADIIPDSALSAIDQRLIKVDAQIRAANEINQIALDEKADNIKYNSDTNELQLYSGSNQIGDKVVIKTGEANLEDGIPVIDFGNYTGKDEEDDDGDDIIEF